MELSRIVFIQVCIIFILMAVGFIFKKFKIITETGTKQMTDILLMAVTPCVLINAYQKDYTQKLVSGLAVTAFAAIVIHLLAIVISTLLFRKNSDERYKVSIVGSVYSNCGFMAIPLLSATMGEDGVFFGSAYLAVFTVLYWTHGICVYSGSIREVSLKKIIINPGIIGTFIAIILFIFKIKLPYPVKESVSYIAGLNTPLAMIVMGAYVAGIDIKKALKNFSVYAVTGIRLILIPVIAIVVLKLLNVDDEIAKTILISTACPTAAITALLAEKYNLDASYGAEIVSISTIFSIITIPLILLLY